MKRLLPWLGSLFVFAAALFSALVYGGHWFQRKDRIYQPYDLPESERFISDLGPCPLDNPPTSIAKLGPRRDQVQFTVTNHSDVPLTYWGPRPDFPITYYNWWQNGVRHKGGGAMCGFDLVEQHLGPGQAMRFTDYLGEHPQRARYFIYFSTPDRKGIEVFLGEYFPE